MFLGLLVTTGANAGCLDSVAARTLPERADTADGILIEYRYGDPAEDVYWLSWAIGDRTVGPYGPYLLQPSCSPLALEHASDRFLVFRRGCGTFCWSYSVFAVDPTLPSSVNDQETFLRPLAFDAPRNLMAYYSSLDEITIRNLVSGRQQVLTTPYTCITYSGLCFRDFSFHDDSVEYIWNIDYPEEETLVHALDRELLTE